MPYKTYTYRVKTVCLAAVTEDWIVTSDRPLADADVQAAVLDEDESIAGVRSLDRVQSSAGDPHERCIISTTDETA